MAGVYWREAASLIIVGHSRKLKFAKDVTKKHNLWNANYDVLFLKRSSKSSFFPEAYVFPGGELDEADTSPKWLSLFDHHGYSEEDLVNHFRLPNTVPDFSTNKVNHKLHPELAFRICALRETFEETGLLLAASNEKLKNAQSCMACMEDAQRQEWRSRVHQNAGEFLTLFKELKKLPNIWNLHEWSRWLTPTFFKKHQKRFDTKFFVTSIDAKIPLYAHDTKESDEIKVFKPIELLESFNKKESLLAPPQLYELSRLLNFTDYEDLMKFAEFRSQKGTQRWLPVKVKASDGNLTVLPGDDLFPTHPELYEYEKENIFITESVEKSREECKYVNRFEFKSSQRMNLVVNVHQIDNHINPISLLKIFKT